uniref:response regulator n=1 Tax=Clostridium sp. NkU-1 TaxID=1095009 RepID=UPI0006D06859
MYRILIVDDEDYVRDLLVRNIQNSALEVDVVAVAGDGEEGLREALLNRPDIVITDIAMPFMNGLELIRRLQEAGLYSKNVVISGYDEFDYAKQAISLGVKDYLLKPFLPREMTDVLAKVIQELDSQKVLQQNMSLLKEQAMSRAGLAREKALKALIRGKEWGKEPDCILEGRFYAAGVIRMEGGAWDFGKQEQVEEFLMLIRDAIFQPVSLCMQSALTGSSWQPSGAGLGKTRSISLKRSGQAWIKSA